MSKYFIPETAAAVLSSDQEREFSRRIQKGDMHALKKFVEANIRLVIKIAWDYVSSGYEIEDLVQEGCLGLINAAQKYDYDHNVRFSTYAAWWIKQSISRAISNKNRSIRIPYRKEDLLRSVKSAINILYQEKQRTPNCSDIAKYLHVDREDVVEILHISETLASLDAQSSDYEGLSMYDYYEDTSYAPDRELMREAELKSLDNFLGRLGEREKQVVMSRYGLKGRKKLTLGQLSKKMRLSNEAIRQIEIRAINKIRGFAEADYSVA